MKKTKLLQTKTKLYFKTKKFISFKKKIMHYESGLEVTDTSLKKLTQAATCFNFETNPKECSLTNKQKQNIEARHCQSQTNKKTSKELVMRTLQQVRVVEGKLLQTKTKLYFETKKFISFKKKILHYESGLQVTDTSLKKLTQGVTYFNFETSPKECSLTNKYKQNIEARHGQSQTNKKLKKNY